MKLAPATPGLEGPYGCDPTEGDLSLSPCPYVRSQGPVHEREGKGLDKPNSGSLDDRCALHFRGPWKNKVCLPGVIVGPAQPRKVSARSVGTAEVGGAPTKASEDRVENSETGVSS